MEHKLFSKPAAANYSELSGPYQAGRRPLVSIIVPVYNRAKLLPAALQSITDQTFTDWEALIVDDGSSDSSAEEALRLGQPGKVRVIRHERNMGAAVARNSGISAARGRYVAFLDSDDSWHPEKLKRQVEAVEAEPDPDMVFCATRTCVFREGRFVHELPKRAPYPEELWSEFLYVNGGFAQTSSFFLSRELAMKVGFHPSVTPLEDHLFFLESGAQGARYRLVCEPLTNWNEDSRSDRLSLSVHRGRGFLYVDRASRFFDVANGLLTKKAILAFNVRHLGPALFRKNPLQAVRLFRKALAEDAVLPQHLLAVCARIILPPSAVAILRRIYLTP